ncbi:hypothetical protein M378DRAFT_155607, partial [Amanita muscaria Koide BX008]
MLLSSWHAQLRIIRTYVSAIPARLLLGTFSCPVSPSPFNEVIPNLLHTKLTEFKFAGKTRIFVGSSKSV